MTLSKPKEKKPSKRPLTTSVTDLALLLYRRDPALLENSRALARSKLTGGHSAGGLDGLA